MKKKIYPPEIESQPYFKAHEFCSNNEQQVKDSELAGCFYCCKIFVPKEVKLETIDGKNLSCPFCGIDSVIGSNSGYPITVEFMKTMSDFWFAVAE